MRLLWKSALVSITGISLAGCATGGVCSGARIISLSRTDSEDTKREVTAANEYYTKQGCFTSQQLNQLGGAPNLTGNAAAALGLK